VHGKNILEGILKNKWNMAVMSFMKKKRVNDWLLVSDVQTSESGVEIKYADMTKPKQNQVVVGDYHTHPYYNQINKVWASHRPLSDKDMNTFSGLYHGVPKKSYARLAVMAPPDICLLSKPKKQTIASRVVMDNGRLVRVNVNMDLGKSYNKYLNRLDKNNINDRLTREEMLIQASMMTASFHRVCLYRSTVNWQKMRIMQGQGLVTY
jgi:proteasome lid subunit RPN8/RPN11